MKRKRMCSVLAAAGGVLLLLLVGLMGITVLMYESVFGQRYTSDPPYALDELDGLQAEPCEFTAKGGHSLAGYHYFADGMNPKGVLVFAHGLGGGGHRNYLDILAWFVSRDYLVFSYDVTGNDDSGGKSVEGLPRGVMDLDAAISYVKADSRYRDLPIVLMGHSWGGYSVGAVLNYHPDVSAVVSLAGFDCSADLILQQGREMVGGSIGLLAPFVSVLEQMKFGGYAGASALSGFEKTDASVMIVHSDNDTTVLAENGYDKYFARFEGDPRFTFLSLHGRGHNYMLYSDASMDYRERLNADYTAYVQENGGVYSAELREAFLEQHLDKALCYQLDVELMKQILAFFDASCQA